MAGFDMTNQQTQKTTLPILHPLDIIVTRDKTPLSWWIRVKSGSAWSHVCTAGEDQTIYTTGLNGFSHVPAETYLAKKSFAIYRMPFLEKAQLDYGLRLCHQQLAKPYAYRDLLALVMKNYLGQGVVGLTFNSKNFFCSEFVAYLYQQIGLKLAPQKHKEPSGYTPVDCTDDIRLNCLAVVNR